MAHQWHYVVSYKSGSLSTCLLRVFTGGPIAVSDNIQLLTYVEVDMDCHWTVNVILTDAERRSIWLSLLFNNTPCLPKHKSTSVLLYNKCMLCISCHFWPRNVHVTDGSCKITWRSDVTFHKLVNITSAMFFATSHPANHAICSFIDSSGYASGPIRRCLFRDYIIICFLDHYRDASTLS